MCLKYFVNRSDGEMRPGGAPLPKLTHASRYGEEELKFAAENKLYCKHCGQAFRDEEWVINKFN